MPGRQHGARLNSKTRCVRVQFRQECRGEFSDVAPPYVVSEKVMRLILTP